jgi:hypothetical protein
MGMKNVARIALMLSLLLVGSGAQCSGQPAVERQADTGSRAAASQSTGTQPASAQSAAGPAAAPSEAAPPRIAARNVVGLREQLGKTVVAHGRIARAARSKSGHHFLNFANSELTAVCFPADVANFPEGGPAGLFADKDVEVTGPVELYQGKLQIRIRGPKQVRAVTATATPEPEGVKLKKIGRDTWMSPAGLRYQGRDPDGLTRVEHVARHARDIPERDGPHGVFDGGEAVALAVIDEAWMLAEQQKLRPAREGDRSSYTVSLGRRVGYLGGRTGADKNHPPLRRVFIVFETGTKNIITAFPK